MTSMLKTAKSLIRNSSKIRAFLKTMKAYCIIFIQVLRCHMFSILIRKVLKITNSNEMEELKRAYIDPLSADNV